MKCALLLACIAACTIEPSANEDSIEIDLAQCKTERLSAFLPFGSLWIDVQAISPYVCELTLGGETENPNYDGAASQRCFFYRYGTISVDVPSGGRAYLDKPSCVDANH